MVLVPLSTANMLVFWKTCMEDCAPNPVWTPVSKKNANESPFSSDVCHRKGKRTRAPSSAVVDLVPRLTRDIERNGAGAKAGLRQRLVDTRDRAVGAQREETTTDGIDLDAQQVVRGGGVLAQHVDRTSERGRNHKAE